MKVKYFLRGLGFGILITTLLLFVSMDKNKSTEMTDEQIVERAKELGMLTQDEVDDYRLGESLDNIKASLKATEVPESSPEVSQGSESVSPSPSASQQLEENSTQKTDKASADESSSNEVADAKASKAPTASEKTTSDKTTTSNKKNTDTTKNNTTNSSTNKNSSTQKTNSKNTSNKITDTIAIKIEAGMVSKSIAKYLYQKNVIGSATDFNNYLIEHKLTNKIIAGEYKIPVDATYEEIVEIIT